MDHSGHDMDHSGHGMDHSGHGMDHSGHDMDHSAQADHSGHDMDHSAHVAMQVVNATAKAIVDAMNTGDHSAHMNHSTHMDHSAHMDHNAHMGHNSHMDMDMDMDMAMSFHFGHDETILFDFWKTNSIGTLIGSMIGIFILAMLYEGLKYWREHLFRTAIAAMQYCASKGPGDTEASNNKPSHYMEQIIMPPTMNMLSRDHTIQTLLHVVQMIVSYLLMLIFMTYNVWLCLAVVFGAGVGYFLFGWRKSVVVDITEHCH